MRRIAGVGFIVTCLSLQACAAGKSSAQLAAEKQQEDFRQKMAESKAKTAPAKKEDDQAVRSAGGALPSGLRQRGREPADDQETPLSAGAKIGFSNVERTMKAGREEYLLKVPVKLSDALRDVAMGDSNRVKLVAYFLSKYSDTTREYFGFYRFERTVKERGYIVGRITRSIQMDQRMNNPTTAFLVAEFVESSGLGAKDNIDVSAHYVELLVDGVRIDSRLEETEASVDNLKRKYRLPNEWWLLLKGG